MEKGGIKALIIILVILIIAAGGTLAYKISKDKENECKIIQCSPASHIAFHADTDRKHVSICNL